MSIIHETILKDIIDIIGDAKDLIGNEDRVFGGKDYHFTSLTKNSKNLILVFPVLCTKGISIETASMISKAIEKHCVTLLQMLLASVQITDTTNLQDYISKFHSNISIGDKITVDDFINFTNNISEAAEMGKLKITDREAFNIFKESLNNFNKVVNTINEYSLKDFECHKNNNGYDVVLESIRHRPGLKVAAKRLKNDEMEEDIRREKLLYDKEKIEYKRKNLKDNNINQIDPNRKDLVEKLSANDVKKANELMPTKVTVDFYSKDKNTGNAIKFERGLIGVKCKLYTVDSLEIIERISTKYADTNWVRELVRATSGEISFWRDFIFALDKAKIDALNSTRKGSSAKMFKVLERRATKNRLSKWKANRADCAPITTLVVNQDEVEYLKKDYDVNIENRNIALKLMDSYNLMGLVIVDEPAEAASFIWDEGNDADFETLSFRNLERESDDKNYRKVINLMTKISR